MISQQNRQLSARLFLDETEAALTNFKI